MFRYFVFLLVPVLAIATAGCPNDGFECVEVTPDTCTPLYEPTFDNVFNRTLAPTCAAEGGACHSADGESGGMAFTDADTSYDLLVGDGQGDGRVIPFDPGCSLMVARLESDRPSFQMPPGDPLPSTERCSIIQWINNGAQR